MKWQENKWDIKGVGRAKERHREGKNHTFVEVINGLEMRKIKKGYLAEK